MEDASGPQIKTCVPGGGADKLETRHCFIFTEEQEGRRNRAYSYCPFREGSEQAHERKDTKDTGSVLKLQPTRMEDVVVPRKSIRCKMIPCSASLETVTTEAWISRANDERAPLSVWQNL